MLSFAAIIYAAKVIGFIWRDGHDKLTDLCEACGFAPSQGIMPIEASM